MNKDRMEAFSDGVIAILITIMILELRVPDGTSWIALRPLVPTLLAYVLSFVFLGIYWNNHHHMLQATKQVTGGVLWANLHLLFWLSLVPFVTAWMGRNVHAAAPTAAYGIVLLMDGIAYVILQSTIVSEEGHSAALARAVGRDRKGKLSVVLYVFAIALAFVHEWMAQCIYVIVALIWLVPDRRIERVMVSEDTQPDTTSLT